MIEIAIIRRSSDFMACILRDSRAWEAGKTIDDLVKHLYLRFGQEKEFEFRYFTSDSDYQIWLKKNVDKSK